MEPNIEKVIADLENAIEMLVNQAQECQDSDPLKMGALIAKAMTMDQDLDQLKKRKNS